MIGFGARLVLAVSIAALSGGLASAQPAPTETGFVQVEEDVRLFYQRYGTGTPTLFVPNRLELVHSFAPLFEAFDAVTWDPRGRGLSSRPADLSRYGIEAELADAEAIRRHFAADRVTYVGISLWANLAVLYAARHPESVERVVALSPLAVQESAMGPPENPVRHDLADVRRQIAEIEEGGVEASEAYRHCVLSQFAFFAVDYVDLADMKPFQDANTCQYANERTEKIEEVIFGGMFASFGAWDWRDDAASVRAPVLLVFGAREGWDLTGVRAYADLLPDVGWAELPASAHHVWNDERELVLGMIERFVKGDWPTAARRSYGPSEATTANRPGVPSYVP